MPPEELQAIIISSFIIECPFFFVNHFFKKYFFKHGIQRWIEGKNAICFLLLYFL